MNFQVKYNPCETKNDEDVKRAFYTGLENKNIRLANIKDMDHWSVCLKRYLKNNN